MPIGAAIGSAVIGVGGSIAKGVIGSNAASNAGQLAGQAAQQGNQLIQQQQSANTANLSPFIGYGQQESGALAGLLGVGGNPAASQSAFQNWLNSTNYNFELGQGLNAVGYANAPAFSSGATAKALSNYAQGQAGNYLGQYEQLLQQGAGQGIQSGLGLGQINMLGAEQQSANLLAAAGVQGTAGIAGANALGNMVTGISSGLSSFGQNQNVQSAFGNLFGGGSTPAAAAAANPSAFMF